MDQFNALLLARIQFAFTISFHIIFPAFSIGLASYLAVLNGLWLKTGQTIYLSLFDYWKKIFAVVFGMGVVSGVVMSYQFGTNWSVFSDKTGPVLGPLLAYEVLSAFFLEAGFLGIMLFGSNRISPKLHFFATVMVALGTLVSAFWILAANSWMHTPKGYAINTAGQFIVTDWWAVIFNPSFPYRLVHTVLAAYLTTALVVSAVGAFHLLKNNTNTGARIMFSMAMWMVVIVAPAQIIAGDRHGLNTLKYQPAKIAAMEGHFETQAGAPLILIGLPNPDKERIDYSIIIPKLGSFILTHDWNGMVKGLKEWPEDKRPSVNIVFWSFRIMLGIGFTILAMGVWSLYLRNRRRFYETPWMYRAALLMGPAGFIAVLAGWITTEAGRQPYTVYGLLMTSQSVSSINTTAVGITLIAFIMIYFMLFGAGVFYVLRLMSKPPMDREPDISPNQPILATGLMPAPVIVSNQTESSL
ncbi:MAG: cytochrome bd-I ubiquinol oxidase subunit 1 apoprotein [Candidatus Nitrotoga sp. SPKER]|nr:MAG: cytochrome bd-I ubiquinol oxidase subunit 1 apoprotein [Candidatus Nitrotoga sp. SPKER]